MNVGYSTGLMKSPRFKEDLGEKKDKGYIIQPDKADTGDKVLIVQQKDLAFHFLNVLVDGHGMIFGVFKGIYLNSKIHGPACNCQCVVFYLIFVNN
jgi:hypothetical protein